MGQHWPLHTLPIDHRGCDVPNFGNSQLTGNPKPY